MIRESVFYPFLPWKTACLYFFMSLDKFNNYGDKMEYLVDFIAPEYLDYFSSWELIPSENKMIDSLVETEIYPVQGKEIFLKAMEEAVAYHLENNRKYRSFLEYYNFKKGNIGSLEMLEKLPWICVDEFKNRDLHSIRPVEYVYTLNSSGTSGKKSYNNLDLISLNREFMMDYLVHREMGVLDADKDCNILLFTNDIKTHQTSGMTFSSYVISDMVNYKRREHLLHVVGGRNTFPIDNALKIYREFVDSGLPVRWIGYPAFMYKLAVEIKKRGLPRLDAAHESWIQTSGGWKNLANEEIGFDEFCLILNEATGIGSDNIRDLYGASEHGVGYLECCCHKKHVPVFSHVVSRDPYTLEVNKNGEVGLLHFFTPVLRSLPSLSLLSTDFGSVTYENCSCGISGPVINFVRRAGKKMNDTCALRILKEF